MFWRHLILAVVLAGVLPLLFFALLGWRHPGDEALPYFDDPRGAAVAVFHWSFWTLLLITAIAVVLAYA